MALEEHKKAIAKELQGTIENRKSERRSGGDRRKFKYTVVTPERRKWNRRMTFYERRGQEMLS